ncbi:MAG: hypothetical protein ACJASM_002627 [Salibacteraceae bacterium]|jgi:hypothetical protein
MILFKMNNELKHQIKTPLTIDLEMFLAQKTANGGLQKQDALDIGSNAACAFIHNIEKENGTFSDDELISLIAVLEDFYNETFVGEFTNDDLNIIVFNILILRKDPNSEERVNNYLKPLFTFD